MPSPYRRHCYFCDIHSAVLFINFHTHRPTDTIDNIPIVNLTERFNETIRDGYFSVGLHPWYIKEETFAASLRELKDAVLQDEVLLIGECGLDKVCNTPFPLQLSIFEEQILLANQVNKPLLIHCVRAYDEVLDLLSATANKVPVVFHGFNRNLHIAQQVLAGGYYLSIGKAVMNESFHTVLRDIPQNRLFLETDDAHNSIAEIYQHTADAVAININTLSKQIGDNAATLFGKKISL